MKKVFLVVSVVFSVLLLKVDVGQASLEMDLGRIIITPNRYEQEGYRVAGNVSVITSKQIEQTKAQSVPELLQQVEGVYIYNNSTLRTSQYDIRGFGDTATRNTLVLVDGRRLNSTDSGAAQLIQIPVNAVERVEVIRGASSVMYGDNAVGGVINIVTKKGKAGAKNSVGVVYDSYGTVGENLTIQGKKDKLSYYFYGQYLDKNNYRARADELHKDLNTRLDYEFSDKLSASVQYGNHDEKYELPGGLDSTELSNLGRRGFADQGNIAESEDQYVKLSLDAEPTPGDTYLGNILLDLTYRDQKLLDVFGTFNSSTVRDVSTKGITLKYVFDRELFNRKVDFITGIDHYDHNNDILTAGSFANEVAISRTDIGAYASLQVETLDNLFLIGGSRYYKARYTFQKISAPISFETQKPSDWVHSAGLKYEYGKGSNVHFSYQQTFRYLTTNEWYNSFSGTLNTDLKQQTGDQFEVGIKHNFEDKAVVSVTPYWIETDNEIFFDATNGIFGANSNYDKIRRVGVETSSRVDLLEFFPDADYFDTLEFFANYTYQNAEFKEGTNKGNKVPWVPEHQASTGLKMKFAEHFSTSLITNFVGSRYAINDILNDFGKAEHYVVTDIHLAYEQDNYEVFMQMNNVFDQKYETYHAVSLSADKRDVFPAPEKNFLLGVNIKF